jgi:acyl carrier protein
MHDLDARLTNCFVSAFPDLRESEIPSATVERTPSWDSMGGLTLAALIEEEFGVTFSDDVIETLRSYAVIRAELAKSMAVEAEPS